MRNESNRGKKSDSSKKALNYLLNEYYKNKSDSLKHQIFEHEKKRLDSIIKGKLYRDQLDGECIEFLEEAVYKKYYQLISSYGKREKPFYTYYNKSIFNYLRGLNVKKEYYLSKLDKNSKKNARIVINQVGMLCSKNSLLLENIIADKKRIYISLNGKISEDEINLIINSYFLHRNYNRSNDTDDDQIKKYRTFDEIIHNIKEMTPNSEISSDDIEFALKYFVFCKTHTDLEDINTINTMFCNEYNDSIDSLEIIKKFKNKIKGK